MKQTDSREIHRDRREHIRRQLYISSPGVPYGHQGYISVWAQLQDAVFRLDSDPEQLDVLRRVGAHTRVILHTGGA